VFGIALHLASAQSVHSQSFTAEQIQKGSSTYGQNCSDCHGPRMEGAQGVLDLTKFPKDQRERFITTVSNGRASMPPWRGMLSPEDIANLWAYVITNGKQ
jgi:mono/diheme cytochrome c family protein